MNPKDLSAEYANIKAYCRKEAAKSFKHPLAKAEAAQEPEPGESAEHEASELSDTELDEMLSEV
jgi:hypothetical protein